MNNLLLDAGGIVGIIIAVVAIVLVIVIVSVIIKMRNDLVSLRNIVDEGWATIDVQLQKRYDLVPNLVETVKGYAKHESETLEKVIAARSQAMESATGSGKIAAEKEFTGTLVSLMALQEKYPDLKANTNFMSLQADLKSIENDLASARKYYNGTVKTFNTKIDLFPSNIVAKSMKLEKRPFFEIDSQEARKAVKVQF